MNRISTLAVLLIFLLSAVNVRAQVTENSDKYKYEGLFYRILSEEEKTVALTKGDKPYWGGVHNIPASIILDGLSYAVTGIDDEVFMDCSSSLTVLLPNTIKRIGNRAFATTSHVEIYSKIMDTESVELGEMVFGETNIDCNVYVLKEAEDSYLVSPDWNGKCNIYGCVNYDGITYHVYEKYGNKLAKMTMMYMGEIEESSKTEITIPSDIIYDGEKYQNSGWYNQFNKFSCSWWDKVTELYTNFSNPLSITGLPELRKLVSTSSQPRLSLSYCPKLEIIEYVNPVVGLDFEVKECFSLKVGSINS